MTAGASPDRPVRLSVCVPTYNFGAFIGATLENVLSQAVDGVEVVVLDGGSTDETPDVVRSLQQRFSCLRYRRLDARGGIDRDIARTVEMARGEYCWLFSSDDLMKSGAIPRMLEAIASGADVYVCGLTLCDRDMRPLREHPILRPATDAEFDLGDERDRRSYFERAETTTAFFSFAGSLIFKKERWDAVELDEEFVGSLWAHVARFFRLIPRGLRVGFLAAPYLYKRSQNDSFLDRGIAHRQAIAIDGYHRLARTFFAEDGFEARNIRRVVANEFPPWILLDAKLESREGGHAEDGPLLDRLAADAYRDRSLRNVMYRAIYTATPVTGYKLARTSIRIGKRLLGLRTTRPGLSDAAA
jgi:abequosyltransferase